MCTGALEATVVAYYHMHHPNRQVASYSHIALCSSESAEAAAEHRVLHTQSDQIRLPGIADGVPHASAQASWESTCASMLCAAVTTCILARALSPNDLAWCTRCWRWSLQRVVRHCKHGGSLSRGALSQSVRLFEMCTDTMFLCLGVDGWKPQNGEPVAELVGWNWITVCSALASGFMEHDPEDLQGSA
jgi:hypothetical protein